MICASFEQSCCPFTHHMSHCLFNPLHTLPYHAQACMCCNMAGSSRLCSQGQNPAGYASYDHTYVSYEHGCTRWNLSGLTGVATVCTCRSALSAKGSPVLLGAGASLAAAFLERRMAAGDPVVLQRLMRLLTAPLAAMDDQTEVHPRHAHLIQPRGGLSSFSVWCLPTLAAH